MDRQRLNIETQLLQRYFPKRFKFTELGTSSAALHVGVQSNSKKVYVLKVVMGTSFPNSVPPVYITSPSKLRSYDGKRLKDYGTSGAMHLLSPDSQGNIQLCHYIESNWATGVTLYKVILKARIWIEAYEGHMQTGEPIDYYLAHQKMV